MGIARGLTGPARTGNDLTSQDECRIQWPVLCRGAYWKKPVTSRTRSACVPLPICRNTETFAVGSVVNGAIAPLAIAGSPALKLSVDTNGIVVLYGQILKFQTPVGATIVTLNITALAAVGIAHVPVTGNDRVVTAARDGPPSGPVGLRVSTTRHGANVKN